MNRGTAGIILIMLAILGLYLYIKSGIIKQLLAGKIPGSSPSASGKETPIAPDPSGQSAGVNSADTWLNSGGGTVQPGNSGEPFSGSGNVGDVGTANGLGLSNPAFANYASYPDPQRTDISGVISDPVGIVKYGSVGFSGFPLPSP